MRMKQLQLPGRSGFSSQPYRYAYQGQFAERNSVTQNLDFRQRSYDPRIGRWTTTDPLITGFSAYEAMGNNPVVYVDPLGADEDGPPKYGTDSGPAYRKKGKAPKDGMIDLLVLMYYQPGSMVDCGVYGMEVNSGGSSGGGGGGLVPSESVAPNKVRIYGKNLGRNKKLSVTSANKAMNDQHYGLSYSPDGPPWLHTVKEGQNCFDICQEYYYTFSWKDIQELNPGVDIYRKSEPLPTGQKILVPGPKIQYFDNPGINEGKFGGIIQLIFQLSINSPNSPLYTYTDTKPGQLEENRCYYHKDLGYYEWSWANKEHTVIKVELFVYYTYYAGKWRGIYKKEGGTIYFDLNGNKLTLN